MIAPAALHLALRQARTADGPDVPEIALLDIREPGEFKDGHLLLASNAPLSRLEWLAPRLVPRQDARIVVASDRADDPRLRRAADTLRGQGYSRVEILDAGFEACQQAGFVVFTGFNVPSKAFGEWLERQQHTPHIAAEELARRLADPEPPLVLDCRPADEHARGAVPGARNLPGVELARRAEALSPDGRRPIVVHCAGRTRGIVATQTLIDLGYTNPVQVLENGLMGWQLTGHALAATEAQELPALDQAPSSALAERARRFAERCGARPWRPGTQAAGAQRTTYGFTVGTADEAARHTPPGFQHVPGGQLQQGLDDHVAVQGARLVIHADDGVRAALAAGYLRRMGWRDVWWLSGQVEAPTVDTLPLPTAVALGPQALVSTPADTLADGTLVLDLGNSRRYAEHHLPGARFVVRALLPNVLPAAPAIRRLVLCCDDGALSTAAHGEVSALAGAGVEVLVLAGGVAAWQAAGHPLSHDADWWHPAIDVATTPYDYKGDLAAQMQAYIDWELALEANVERDGTLHFHGEQR